MKILKTVTDYAIVLIIVFITYLLVIKIDFAYILQGKKEPITSQQIEENVLVDYVGLPAGEDILRITSVEMWEESSTKYMTIEPTDIIFTGIGILSPWVEPYNKNNKSTNRKRKSRFLDERWDVFDEYIQFYLIQLPDGQYITAHMPDHEAKALKRGESITLPVGEKIKYAVSTDRLETIYKKYGVNTDKIFYCISDTWNDSHQNLIYFLKVGVSIVIFVIFYIPLFWIKRKVFREMSNKK